MKKKYVTILKELAKVNKIPNEVDVFKRVLLRTAPRLELYEDEECPILKLIFKRLGDYVIEGKAPYEFVNVFIHNPFYRGKLIGEHIRLPEIIQETARENYPYFSAKDCQEIAIKNYLLRMYEKIMTELPYKLRRIHPALVSKKYWSAENFRDAFDYPRHKVYEYMEKGLFKAVWIKNAKGKKSHLIPFSFVKKIVKDARELKLGRWGKRIN